MTYAYTGERAAAGDCDALRCRRQSASRRTRTGWSATTSASRRRAISGSICPAGNGSPSAQAPLFAAFDREVPRPSPWHAVVGRDGTLFVQGPELTPATVVDAWFIPDTPGTIRDSAAQPLTVWHGGFTLALQPGKAFQA